MHIMLCVHLECNNKCMAESLGTSWVWWERSFEIYKSERAARAHTQVTGSILQRMNQVDDVREYLPAQAVNLVLIHRLLMWLAPFQERAAGRRHNLPNRCKSSIFCVWTFSFCRQLNSDLYLFLYCVSLSIGTIVAMWCRVRRSHQSKS